MEWRHFSRFQNLQEIEFTNSKLKKVMCGEDKVRHNKAIRHLSYLRYLNLSSNSLIQLDDSITTLLHLEKIDLSNNNLTWINSRFSNFKRRKYLDISNNNLTTLTTPILTLLPEPLWGPLALLPHPLLAVPLVPGPVLLLTSPAGPGHL